MSTQPYFAFEVALPETPKRGLGNRYVFHHILPKRHMMLAGRLLWKVAEYRFRTSDEILAFSNYSGGDTKKKDRKHQPPPQRQQQALSNQTSTDRSLHDDFGTHHESWWIDSSAATLIKLCGQMHGAPAENMWRAIAQGTKVYALCESPPFVGFLAMPASQRLDDPEEGREDRFHRPLGADGSWWDTVHHLGDVLEGCCVTKGENGKCYDVLTKPGAKDLFIKLYPRQAEAIVGLVTTLLNRPVYEFQPSDWEFHPKGRSGTTAAWELVPGGEATDRDVWRNDNIRFALRTSSAPRNSSSDRHRLVWSHPEGGNARLVYAK